jgi:hypothetical protein
MQIKEKEINEASESTPPILGSWTTVYALVFGNLIFSIILFYIFTKVFE